MTQFLLTLKSQFALPFSIIREVSSAILNLGRYPKSLFVVILIFFSFANVFAQGTTCSTATVISINGACVAGTISDATQDLPLYTKCGGRSL